jgi:hypothetical protein
MKTFTLAILMLLHPVHVSLTGIEYDGINRVWSLFVKVWSDDLEADMNLGRHNGAEFTGNRDDRFFQYLSDRIVIYEDSVPLILKMTSAEVDGLEHRFTLKARGKEDARTVTVVNRIMTRLYEDQANMLLISLGGTEEGYRFTVTDTMKSYKVK